MEGNGREQEVLRQGSFTKKKQRLIMAELPANRQLLILVKGLKSLSSICGIFNLFPNNLKRNGIEREALLTGQLHEEETTVDNGGMPAGDSSITPLLLLSVFIAVSGSFAYGSAVGYSSPIESAVMDDLGLSTAQFSLFGSLLTVGGLLGSSLSGKIADLIGRRGAMGLSATLSLLGWIVISISQVAWLLDLGRFLVGISIGITIYVVPVYIAEITPKNLRGGFVSLTQLMTSCGLLVMYFVGSWIPWRILVLIGIIPSLLQLLGIFLIPESPRFLAKLGHNKAEETVLRRLRGNNSDISQEADEIKEFTERLQQTTEVSFMALFQRRYARALVVVFGLMALAGFAGPSGVTYYASSVYESAGFSSSIGSVVMALLQLPSTAIGMYLIDKCGRRPLLMLSAGGMCFCCFLVGLMFLLKENDCLPSMSTYLIVLGLWGYAATFTLGIAALPFVLMSEIFPLNVKGAAGSLASVVSSGSVWASSYTFNFMTEWSYPGTFFILCGLNAFTVLFAAILMPETKGKTLEEIQNSLGHVDQATSQSVSA